MKVVHLAKRGGHAMYKVCRRILFAPTVSANTYCTRLARSEEGEHVPEGEGEVDADGQRHGQGCMLYKSGDMYEGAWAGGRREGKGSMRYADGSVYRGEWKDGKPEGHGTYQYSSGSAYRGGFLGGEKHGTGVYFYANGDVFAGKYAKDARHGWGTLYGSDGRAHISDYKAGEPVGEGMMWSADRRTVAKLADGRLDKKGKTSTSVKQAAEFATRKKMKVPGTAPVLEKMGGVDMGGHDA